MGHSRSGYALFIFYWLRVHGLWVVYAFRYYIGFLCGALFQRACQNQFHTSNVLKAYRAQNLLQEKQGLGHLCHLDLCTVGLLFGQANLRLVLAGLCCKHPEGFWTTVSLRQPLHLPHHARRHIICSMTRYIDCKTLHYHVLPIPIACHFMCAEIPVTLLVLYGHPSALDALMLLRRCLKRACPIRQGQTPSSIPSVKHLVLSTTVENLRHCRCFRSDFIDFIQQQQEKRKNLIRDRFEHRHSWFLRNDNRVSRLWLTASRLLELTVLSLLVWWLGRKWLEDFGFVHGSMSGIFRPKKMNVSTILLVISFYVAASVNFWKQLPFTYCCWVKGNGISDSVDNCLRQKASVGIQEGKHGFWLDLYRTPRQLIGHRVFVSNVTSKSQELTDLSRTQGPLGCPWHVLLISLRELDAKQGSESFGWRCFLEVLSLAKQNQTKNVPWIVAVPFLPVFLLQGRVKGKSLSSSRIHPQMICMRC